MATRKLQHRALSITERNALIAELELRGWSRDTASSPGSSAALVSTYRHPIATRPTYVFLSEIGADGNGKKCEVFVSARQSDLL